MAAHYRIVEWDHYQHYKDRDPPWIKLHRDLLTSHTWVSLTDASRVLAIACMLIAAGTDNKIPTDLAYLRRRAYLDHDPDFGPLVAVGFLEVVGDINALPEIRKQMLAPRKQPLANGTECSSEERREEGEKRRGETERASRSGSRLPDDWQPSKEDRAFAGDFDIDVDATASVFRDYWHAVAGAKGRKTDWPATWRNWVRREAEGKKTRATRPALNGHAASSTFVDDGSQWSARLRGWQQSKFWKPYDWGPEPGVYGCLVPPALLEKVA